MNLLTKLLLSESTRPPGASRPSSSNFQRSLSLQPMVNTTNVRRTSLPAPQDLGQAVEGGHPCSHADAFNLPAIRSETSRMAAIKVHVFSSSIKGRASLRYPMTNALLNNLRTCHQDDIVESGENVHHL